MRHMTAYGTRKHDKGCSRKMAMRSRGGGVQCPCGARWFCY